MQVLTDYLWFNTRERQEFIRITDDVSRIVSASAVIEGMVLVSAMHITAAVYVNDWKHNLTGEDNADAHLKREVLGRGVVVAVTMGKLDFGTWEQIFYAEFDGQRRKRVVVKVMGV